MYGRGTGQHGPRLGSHSGVWDPERRFGWLRKGGSNIEWTPGAPGAPGAPGIEWTCSAALWGCHGVTVFCVSLAVRVRVCVPLGLSGVGESYVVFEAVGGGRCISNMLWNNRSGPGGIHVRARDAVLRWACAAVCNGAWARGHLHVGVSAPQSVCTGLPVWRVQMWCFVGSRGCCQSVAALCPPWAFATPPRVSETAVRASVQPPVSSLCVNP